MKMYNMNRFYEHISALQKSIRWGEINDSRYFAKELMDMGYPGAVFNRLILIAAEDVGLGDPTLISYGRSCSDNFENMIKQYGIKKREAATFPNLCEIVDRAVIAAAVGYKSRLLPMLSFATLWDIYENEDFSENLPEYLLRLAVAVENGDEKQALYYTYVTGIFLNSMDRILTWVQRKSVRRNQNLILQWIDEYKRGKELLVLAGSVVLLCRDLRYTYGEYSNAISQYLPVPVTKAKIPDRSYDMHTRAGKRKRRGFDHFFNVAGTLKNERFPSNWEAAGRKAYYRAKDEGLEKAIKVIEAIKKKL
jgi:hypothetical protein